ncbi:MAG TPA: hypothetical protein VEB43_19355 [Anaeromyxobacter sp.]|nr:hypothetical protein [Anaeromyxobacter sp.]
MGQAVHRGIRGSATLATQPVSPSAVPAEALEPGEMRRLPFAGELLGAARVRSSFVAVPLDAFDEAAPALAPEEQAAYLQLIRLSYGEGRNWCRVPKRALEERLHASERRLLRMLDGLVARGLARPLHRDNRGTLWRVYLPREAAGEAVGDEVLLGRPQRAPSARARPAPQPAPAPEPGASTTAARAPSTDPRAPDPLARALAEARGELDEVGLARAVREIAELRAEGQSAGRIEAAIAAVRAQRRTSGAGSGSGSFTGGDTHGSTP